MAQALRPLRLLPPALLLLFWGLPFGLAGLALLAGAIDAGAWRDLSEVPHVAPQIMLSLFIGSGAALLALVLAAIIVAAEAPRRSLQGWLGGFLAVPHLAFAVGFGFLIMPAGLLTRALGFEAPPPWVTTQDPYGISLMLALVLKEAPFLLFLMLAMLTRPDFALALKDQQRLAASLGHGSLSMALRLVLPQLLRQMLWPIVIVWVYGATVIDVAIAIGPTQPPPFQLSIWRDLNDADAFINARGLAGTLLLVGMLAITGAAIAGMAHMLRAPLNRFLTRGPARAAMPAWPAWVTTLFLAATYLLVLAVLIIIAASPRWPFPLLLPQEFDGAALLSLFTDGRALANSLILALVSAAAAVLTTIGWFEQVPPRWDRPLIVAAVAALLLPPVAIASGQYILFLHLGLDSWFSVLLAQFTPVLAYVFITLRGPYRDFDPRYRSVAHGLNAGSLRFWLRIKAPLLAAALASAAAIGFAVSMAQYVPVQLVGGGAVPTLATEAVTLASGGSRSLLAAYALALMALPAFAFALAGWAGRRNHA